MIILGKKNQNFKASDHYSPLRWTLFLPQVMVIGHFGLLQGVVFSKKSFWAGDHYSNACYHTCSCSGDHSRPGLPSACDHYSSSRCRLFHTSFKSSFLFRVFSHSFALWCVTLIPTTAPYISKRFWKAVANDRYRSGATCIHCCRKSIPLASRWTALTRKVASNNDHLR